MRLRAVALAVAALGIAIALAAARPAQTPGPFLRDFEAYWSAGRTPLHPYSRAIWRAERTVPGVDARRDELLPFVSPPATLLPLRELAKLTYPWAAVLWYALLVLALALLVALVARASGAARARDYAALALLAVASGAVTGDLALGQMALFAVLGATAVAAMPDYLAVGALGTLLASVQPNAALGMLALLGRNRVTLAIALGTLSAYLAGALARGWGWPASYLRVALAQAAAERCDAIQLAPRAIACGFGASPWFASAIALALAATAIVAGLAIARTVREPFARYAAFGALVPFVSSFFHEQDLVVVFAAAGWCALRARATARSIAAIGTVAVAIDWFGLAQRPAGIPQSALLALAALAAFTATADRPWRGFVPIALGLAALFAIAARLAVAHPAPIWPDELGAFQAPVRALAATVWQLEQVRTGLSARAPIWALLRLLSLFGCAALALATARAARTPRPAPEKPYVPSAEAIARV